jgi:signal transduction histidine kinase
MASIVPFLTITICSTLLLVIVYSYLYFTEKKIFSKIWMIAWIFYFIAQILTLIGVLNYNSSIINILSSIFFFASAIFLLKGTYVFFDRAMSILWRLVILLALVWNIIATILKIPFIFIMIPTAVALGMSTVWVGILFIRYSKEQRFKSQVLGICFILWGLHKMDYPFLINIPNYGQWGYIISSILCLSITIIFIFTYFEKIRTDLLKTQEDLIKAQEELITIENNKFKTHFFANISHELKTPLNVILASTQLFELYNDTRKESSEKERNKKTISSLKQNSFRLLKIINNIIDITKADTGFFEIQLKNYNIVNVIEEVSLSILDYIEGKNIYLEFDTEIEEKIMAFDKEKIERIMLNLLSNAVKFTNNEGKIFVNIYDGDEMIIISVKDTGIGIEKEDQEKIFEQFRQIDKSLSRNHEGSGIGLSLVKSLVELHGGKIEVKSEYGHGSEFIIKLPVNNIDGKFPDKELCSLQARKTDIEFSDIY